MAANKKSNALTKAGKKNIAFLESKQLKDATKKNVDFIAKKKKMNALDESISKGKSLPSKNKKYPGDSDVGMKGFKKKPVITVKKK